MMSVQLATRASTACQRVFGHRGADQAGTAEVGLRRQFLLQGRQHLLGLLRRQLDLQVPGIVGPVAGDVLRVGQLEVCRRRGLDPQRRLVGFPGLGDHIGGRAMVHREVERQRGHSPADKRLGHGRTGRRTRGRRFRLVRRRRGLRVGQGQRRRPGRGQQAVRGQVVAQTSIEFRLGVLPGVSAGGFAGVSAGGFAGVLAPGARTVMGPSPATVALLVTSESPNAFCSPPGTLSLFCSEVLMEKRVDLPPVSGWSASITLLTATSFRPVFSTASRTTAMSFGAGKRPRSTRRR